MKRQLGYFPTQRRHGRAKASEQAWRRTAAPIVRPRRKRRFVMQSHAVGHGVSTARLVGTAAVIILGTVLITVWAKRR